MKVFLKNKIITRKIEENKKERPIIKEYCCKEFKRAISHTILYNSAFLEGDRKWHLVDCHWKMESLGSMKKCQYDYENPPIKYCPFCGEKIVYECD